MIMTMIMMLMTQYDSNMMMMMTMMMILWMMLIGACDPNCVLLTRHTWQPLSRSLEILNSAQNSQNLKIIPEFNKSLPQQKTLRI